MLILGIDPGPGPEHRLPRMRTRVTIPVRTRGPNAREHWRVRAKRIAAEREIAAHWLRVADVGRVQPGEAARVVFARHYSSRPMDDDNLPAACKAIRDEVAAALGIDDAPDAPAVWVYQQVKRPRADVGVDVEVSIYSEAVAARALGEG